MRLNHAGITVKDMERSLVFYRDALGLLPVYDEMMPSGRDLDMYCRETGVIMRAVLLADEAGNMIELFDLQSPPVRVRPSEHLKYPSTGLVEISFVVEDLEQLERDLKKHGFGFAVAPYFFEAMGVKAKLLIALDPDGVMVEFTQVLGEAAQA